MHLAVSAYLYVCILAYVNLQFLNLLCCNFVFIANGVWPLRNKTITCLLTYFYLLPKSVNKIISKIIQYYMKLRGIRWRLHSKDKWVIFGNCCMYSLSEIGSFCHWFLCFFCVFRFAACATSAIVSSTFLVTRNTYRICRRTRSNQSSLRFR